MSEIMPTRTLEVIGAEIRALTASMLGNVIEIGRRMVEAKELLPHGEFGPWIKENTGYSNSTANNFMRLFLEYGNKQSSLFGAEVENFQTFGNLSYTKALALLALPSEEEREEFVETHDVESMSTRELQAAIRERDEARKALEEAREELHETAEMLDKTLDERNARGVIIHEHEEALAALEKELEELKNRPIDVAVQEPDPAVIEERAKAIAQEEVARQMKVADRKVDTAVKEREKAIRDLGDMKKKTEEERAELERKLKEAEDKLAAAGEADKAEAEKLRAETEQLKKQLAMSNQATVVFKLRFMAWQQAHQQMSEAFTGLDEETKEKMRAAIRAQVKAWGWADE